MSFSIFTYKGATLELNRIERIQRVRHPFPTFPGIEPEIIEETKDRIALTLALINLIILGASGSAGYFLAGKTLKPISEMLDDQKKFVSDASHELRTPLTSMKTEIEVALKDKDLNLKNIVEKVSKKFEKQIKEKDIILKLELKKAEAYGNETALEELASILLDNAIKYSSKSGKVIIKTDQYAKIHSHYEK